MKRMLPGAAALAAIALLTMLTGCAKAQAADDPILPDDQTAQSGEITPDTEMPDGETADTPDAPAAMLTGTVVKVERSTFLLASDDGLYTASLDVPVLSADGRTTDAAIESGMRVAVYYSGSIAEIYPARPDGVTDVQILSDADDRVGLYLRALDDLWGEDTALNEGIDCLAFSLGGATNLSAGEKEAFSYLAAGKYGLLPVTGTFDELCDAGYIDRDALYFENGLMIELTVSDETEDGFTFDLTKWRGGLAAYTYYGCTATRGADGTWTYEVGAEMIS